MSKIFVQQGNAAVSVSDEMERLVNQLLDANPIIKRAIEDEIEQVYQDAYRQWPVRVIPPKSADRRKEQTIYAIQKSGKTRGEAQAIADSMTFAPLEGRVSPKSQDSKNKLERGIMVTSDELIGFVRNTAPYAWAIQTGQYTLNNLAYGTRTSNTLLWDPVRKAANKLIDVLADDLLKEARK
jgi:hypothetical protein